VQYTPAETGQASIDMLHTERVASLTRQARVAAIPPRNIRSGGVHWLTHSVVSSVQGCSRQNVVQRKCDRRSRRACGLVETQIAC
jgi:hypothetical protein